MGENFTTNVACGAIPSGTEISSTDTIQDIVKNMLYSNVPPTPSTQYENRNIGTWNNISDVNTFFNTYTHMNGYNGLKIGNSITVNDGTYNRDWIIAGFDCEYNQVADDGTTYNNGYGICLVSDILEGGSLPSYNASTSQNRIETYETNLQGIFGNHMVLRNTLIVTEHADYRGDYAYSSNYEWQQHYLTLLTGAQIGRGRGYSTHFDDGEATYTLPLYSHEYFGQRSQTAHWTRNFDYFDYNDYIGYQWIMYLGSFQTISDSSTGLGRSFMIYLR